MLRHTDINQPPVEVDSDTNPSMPGNLNSSVNFSHEAELFWMPSTDDGWVMGYDIYRDDVLIKVRLDANSFIEANLEPATTCRYSVVAVDDEGRRRVPSIYVRQPPGAVVLDFFQFAMNPVALTQLLS